MPEGADPADEADPDDPWERHLSEPLRGRQVIVGFELLAGMTGLVGQLARWGARRPLLIADGRGTGAVPGPDNAEILVVDERRADSLTEQVRARMRPGRVRRHDHRDRALRPVSPRVVLPLRDPERHRASR